ncbi:CopD family protein [Psychrosphaera sp. 1_MG-2023]|uniref:copper resistance D family protein n=1 Tax=Psychrosphaera sp. 1_MG-2023 TaxID=3062643 RepID=UPI0026E139AE|nr:CopD family protein [Psychrosphaera sp. 1_MG-2023]MDO6719173.1 CopD family protein [Psychrosphaera sp. 1_MG-2023]
MLISYWTVMALLLKLANYVAILALAGNLILRILMPDRILDPNNKTTRPMWLIFMPILDKRLMAFLLIGLTATLLHIPIEAGALAENGVSGMIEPIMLDITWNSAIGDQVALRAPAIVLAIFAILFLYKETPMTKVIQNTLLGLALCLMAYSFTKTGHTAEKGILLKLILTIHLVTISSWVGSLLPLYNSCILLSVAEVKTLMRQFGQLAIVIIVLLLLSGIILITQYIGSITLLFTSSYGQLLLLKLFLVSSMLMLGAWHKLRLVPQLSEQSHIVTLKRSIGVELSLAILVLVTTSIFTTFTGPNLE